MLYCFRKEDDDEKLMNVDTDEKRKHNQITLHTYRHLSAGMVNEYHFRFFSIKQHAYSFLAEFVICLVSVIKKWKDIRN